MFNNLCRWPGRFGALRLVFFVSAFALVGCAAPLSLDKAARVALQRAHVGRTVELRQSCYFGDLYAENDLWLLAPLPFSATSHIVDVHGAPVHPTGPRGIVAAGTRLRIERLEFADRWALITRGLMTPRYNPWIYLTLLDDAPQVPTPRKTFVVVLAAELADPRQAEAAVATMLAPEGATTAWLRGRRPTVQVAIAHKEATLGMSGDELIAAMGEPLQRRIGTWEGRRAQRFQYADCAAWLSGDVVVTVRPTAPASMDSLDTQVDVAKR